MREEWMNAFNPGYFGAKRDAAYTKFDTVYGKGKWRIVWRVRDAVTGFLGACVVYEDAYVRFLKTNPDVLEQLLADARDVYDDAVTNVDSGTDYTKQETNRTHIQDIAIRRAVLRLNRTFAGTDLIQIRDKEGKHPLSKTLSPGRVPFHRQDIILPPPPERGKVWWNAGSVEDFYQNNKILQVLQPVGTP